MLEQQKKGYMQRIFSQELRFKDENGNKYPKWVTQKIKELGNVYTGNTPINKQSAIGIVITIYGLHLLI